MNTEQTIAQLQQLKLHGMAARYEALLDLPVHQQPEAHALLAMLTDAELGYRIQQRTGLYMRLSKLRYQAVLEQIHCSAARGFTAEQLQLLCDGSFIEKSENIVISGSTGCGKSYLACALGRQACTLGYRTLYYSMNRFIESLATARLDGTYVKWLNHLAKTPLLILDDFGLQPLTHDMRLTLLQIMEDRYGRGSTIIAAQLPLSKWYDYLNEPTIADAIMDRLTARMHKIDLKGESKRKAKTN